MTAQVIALHSRNDNPNNIEDDFTNLFKTAVEDRRKSQSEQKSDVIANVEEIAERCRIVMNTLLLNEGGIDSRLFRCVIHVSRIIARATVQTPKSFYASDYYLQAIKTDKPIVLREGGDMCYLLCTFFPERANRRCMTVQDCEQMGTQMYYKYYEKSKNTLGLCMGDCFKTMILVAQESICKI
jgi:hypothetical protein